MNVVYNDDLFDDNDLVVIKERIDELKNDNEGNNQEWGGKKERGTKNPKSKILIIAICNQALTWEKKNKK